MKLFAAENLSESFDYSLPASGLWKVVERELNLSLAWYLRIIKGVADLHSPWTTQRQHWEEIEVETRGRSVNLNKHADRAGIGLSHRNGAKQQ